MSDTLVVSEIFLSVQGESTFAGLPCVFVRLTACNLRCSYCDTAYAFSEGKKLSLAEIEAQVLELAKPFASSSASSELAAPAGPTPRSALRAPHSKLPLVELTGGEPLLQPNSLPLMTWLCDQGFTVLLETSGALDIAPVDLRVRRIMDLKCPSSGECTRNRWENLRHLRATDEVKFVLGTQEDYDWAKEQLRGHQLATRCPVLFSWAMPLLPHQQDPSLKSVPAGQTPITRQQLVEQILADGLPVRFQLQMHKFLWPPDQRGV
jgi:7-carboxy-7-deazaguanine synthase